MIGKRFCAAIPLGITAWIVVTPAISQSALPSMVPAGTISGTALAIQGVPAGIPVQSSDPNNAAFATWTPYIPGTMLTAVQTASIRSVGLSLTAAGTIVLTDQAGDTMPLSYSVAGFYELPFAPAMVAFTGGATGSLWVLH